MAIAPTNKREADAMALKLSLSCSTAFLLVGLITGCGCFMPSQKAPGHGCPAATVGLQRVMEVWHAAGLAIIRSRVGAIEPPVVPRITIVRDAASRMAMEEDAVDLSAEG